jgi:hypothetical protein
MPLARIQAYFGAEVAIYFEVADLHPGRKRF